MNALVAFGVEADANDDVTRAIHVGIGKGQYVAQELAQFAAAIGSIAELNARARHC